MERLAHAKKPSRTAVDEAEMRPSARLVLYRMPLDYPAEDKIYSREGVLTPLMSTESRRYILSVQLESPVVEKQPSVMGKLALAWPSLLLRTECCLTSWQKKEFFSSF